MNTIKEVGWARFQILGAQESKRKQNDQVTQYDDFESQVTRDASKLLHKMHSKKVEITEAKVGMSSQTAQTRSRLPLVPSQQRR